MSTVQIDRLLDTTIKQGASDLHLTVGKRPTLRMKGHLRELHRSLSGRTRDAYLAATETIESDFERRRALSALLGTTRQSRM